MCVCVSPILSGKTVFADCKFYEFDWGAANEPYWRISRARAVAGCPRTKAGGRPWLINNVEFMKFILKRVEETPRAAKIHLVWVLEKLHHISPMSPSPGVGHGAIVKIGRYWNSSKFHTLPMLFPPAQHKQAMTMNAKIHPKFTPFIQFVQFPKSDQLSQLT